MSCLKVGDITGTSARGLDKDLTLPLEYLFPKFRDPRLGWGFPSSWGRLRASRKGSKPHSGRGQARSRARNRKKSQPVFFLLEVLEVCFFTLPSATDLELSCIFCS